MSTVPYTAGDNDSWTLLNYWTSNKRLNIWNVWWLKYVGVALLQYLSSVPYVKNIPECGSVKNDLRDDENASEDQIHFDNKKINLGYKKSDFVFIQQHVRDAVCNRELSRCLRADEIPVNHLNLIKDTKFSFLNISQPHIPPTEHDVLSSENPSLPHSFQVSPSSLW